MHLIQQEEGIVRKQASLDWPHTPTDTVTAEEQPRTDLVDCRNENRRDVGTKRPRLVPTDAAP